MLVEFIAYLHSDKLRASHLADLVRSGVRVTSCSQPEALAARPS